jgi:ribose transport system substrate-binding protein
MTKRVTGTWRARSLWALLLTLALVLAACGGEDTTGDVTGVDDDTTDTDTAAPGDVAGDSDCETVTLVTSIRSLSNEYHANWQEGAGWYAEEAGLAGSHQVITDEGDPQQQLSTIRSLVADGGSCVVISADPTTSSVTEAMVEAVEEAGAYLVTYWNKPDDLHPADYEHWVAHISFDGTVSGYDVAVELFEAMGGEGNIVALQGILDNVPAQQRFAGLQRALEEYPDITLLDDQTAEWDRTQAQDIMQTWITQYGDEIDGVFAANDNMGLGALEALRGAGLAGEVPVVGVDAVSEALEAIENGEFIATSSPDPWWQGGMGLAIGHAALRGDIDPTQEPPEHREFYGQAITVTGDNIDQFIDPPSPDDYDWTDLFGRSQGPIE